MCLADGRMQSRSYSLSEVGRWVTEIIYFEKNDVENIRDAERMNYGGQSPGDKYILKG